MRLLASSRATVLRSRLLRLVLALAIFGAMILAEPGNNAGAQPQSSILRDLEANPNVSGTPQRYAELLKRTYFSTDLRMWAGEEQRVAAQTFILSLAEHGLDERASFLAGQLSLIPSEPTTLSEDIEVTSLVLRAGEALIHGSVSRVTLQPWTIEAPSIGALEGMKAPRDGFDLLRQLRALEPQAPAYERLIQAYSRYVALARQVPWPVIGTSTEVEFQSSDPRTLPVIQRLRVLGDLGSQSDVAEVRAAVKRFQQRHGLQVDGRVGPATLSALNVSPAERARQIAINLEYWRLLPRDWPARYIAVNIASATLALIEGSDIVYAGRVIVGDRSHQTPVMRSVINAVTFNPPWDIPRSIAVREILPHVQRQPEYLEQRNIVIVDRHSDPFGRQIDWRTYGPRGFPFRFRQLPGAGNALGLVKFEMPSAMSIFLHDTPNRDLFDKEYRALSHGCVRVACADDLASRLIESPDRWGTAAIDAQLAEGSTRTVALPRPIPVFLLYFTAFVDDSGLVHFRSDIYGRDAVVRSQLN